MSTVTRRAAVLIALLAAALTLFGAGGAPATATRPQTSCSARTSSIPTRRPSPRPSGPRWTPRRPPSRAPACRSRSPSSRPPRTSGSFPSLFGKPQAYARFLDQEISFQRRQPLLVVMAAGYGLAGVAPAGVRAVSALPKPAGTSSLDLARAARTAVTKLAVATGHAPAPVASTKRSSGGGGQAVLLIVLVLAALAVATALVVIRVRRSSAPER